MISILTVMRSGELIETAIIGREGVVGGWVAIDGSNSNTQTTVQIAGSALEIPTTKFLEAYNAGNSFRTAINKYQGIILFQAHKARRATPSTPLRRACAAGFCIRRTLLARTKLC